MNTTQDTFQNHYYKDNQGNIYVGDWCTGLTEITEEEYHATQVNINLRAEHDKLQAWFDITDRKVSKCSDLDIKFCEAYPTLHKQRKLVRVRINEIRDILKSTDFEIKDEIESKVLEMLNIDTQNVQ